MRRKLLMGLCLAVLVSFAAGDYLFNRSRGGQDAPKKAEPGEKKDELFDILKKSLEAKSEPGAVPPLPDSPVPIVPPPVSFKKDADKKPAGESTLPPLDAPKDKDKNGGPPLPIINQPPTLQPDGSFKREITPMDGGPPPVEKKPVSAQLTGGVPIVGTVAPPLPPVTTDPLPPLTQSDAPVIQPKPASVPMTTPPACRAFGRADAGRTV